MRKFFGIFGISKKKKRSDVFLIQKDIKNINYLLIKKEERLKEVEKIDRKIVLIQKSTKTTIPRLQPVHENLRQKYKWYYKWHLNPMANTFHWSFFSLYIFSLCVFFFLGVFGGPYKTVQAATECAWTNNIGDHNWETGGNWTCGHEPTVDNYITFASVDDLNINSNASVAAFTTLDYWPANNITVAPTFSLTVAGTMTIGIGTTISGPTLNANGGFTLSGTSTFTNNNFKKGVTINNGANFTSTTTTFDTETTNFYYKDSNPVASLQDVGSVTALSGSNPFYVDSTGNGMKATRITLTTGSNGIYLNNSTLILTGTGTPLSINTGRIFRTTGSTVKYVGNGPTYVGNIPTSSNLTFNNLELLPPADGVTYRLATASSKTINCTGSLTIGDGVHAGIIDHDYYDPAITIYHDIIVAAGATFTKSATATITFYSSMGGSSSLIDNTTTGQDYGKVTITTGVGEAKILQLSGTASNFTFTTLTISHGQAGNILNINDKNLIVTSLANSGLITTSGNGSNLTIPTASVGKFTFTNNASALPSKTYSTLTLNAGGTSSGAIIATNLTLTTGTLDVGGNNLTVSGSISGSGTISTSGTGANLTLPTNAGNVTFTNTASALPSKTYATLTLEAGGASSGAITATTFNLNGGGAFTSGGTTNVTTLNLNWGEFILGGTLNVSKVTIYSIGHLTAGAHDINVSGAGSCWADVAGRYSGSNTVTFNGTADQLVIGGFLTFNNLTIANPTSVIFHSISSPMTVNGTLYNHTAGSTMVFREGETHTVNNFDFLGESANTIKLRSSTPGSHYNLNITNVGSADYLDISDTHKNGNILAISHAKDSGNNSGFYLTDKYTATIPSENKDAGTNLSGEVVAKDFYDNTVTSDSFTTLNMTSTLEEVKFYTNDSYVDETTTRTLGNGAATIYFKNNDLYTTQGFTYTAADNYGKRVISGAITSIALPIPPKPKPSPSPSDNVIIKPNPQAEIVEETKTTLVKKLQESPAAQTTTKILEPVLKTVAVVGSISLILQIMQVIPSAAPLSASFFPMLFTTASLRRRKKPWGNVFDSLTGHPVDLAVVRLYSAETGRLIDTSVTDFSGRFNFLIGAGSYYIKVQKNNYDFPVKISKFKASQLSSRFGKETDIYLGDKFTIKDKSVAINLSIPLEPILEEVTNKIKVKKAFRESFDWILIGTSYIALPLMFSGAAISAVGTVVRPTDLNYVTNGAYLVLLSGFLVTQRIRRLRLGSVFDSKTREPIANANVTIFDKEYNAIRQTQTTDKNGNFTILAQKGSYYLVIEAKGYKFPSTTLKSTRKEIFYTGGTINQGKAGFINVDVPMDKQ